MRPFIFLLIIGVIIIVSARRHKDDIDENLKNPPPLSARIAKPQTSGTTLEKGRISTNPNTSSGSKNFGDQSNTRELATIQSAAVAGPPTGNKEIKLEGVNLTREQMAQMFPDLTEAQLDEEFKNQSTVPMFRPQVGEVNVPFGNLKTECPTLFSITEPVYLKVDTNGSILNAFSPNPDLIIPQLIYQCKVTGGNQTTPFTTLYSPTISQTE